MQQSVSSNKNPITLSFNTRHLDSPHSRILEAISDALNAQNLESESDYRVDIPPSQIERGIYFAELFQKHVGSDEPGSLNRDEHGNMLRLSTDQIESIQHEAVINVPSRSYPSRYHVWKLNSLLQTGSVNIKVAFQNIASSSLGHLIITIPANLVSNYPDEWSVWHGMKSVLVGMWGILHGLVGLKVERICYGPTDISIMVENRKQETVARTLMANANHLNPRSFFDDRLYGKKPNKLLQSMITRIENDQNLEWGLQRNALRAQFLKELGTAASQYTMKEKESILDTKMKAKELENLNSRYLQDGELSSAFPGYGSLLSNSKTASHVTKEFEDSFQLMVAEKKQLIRDNLVMENPILSRINEWLESRVSIQSQENYEEFRLRHMELIATRLDEMGLYQEANIFRECLNFQRNEEQQYIDQLQKVTRPAMDFVFHIGIWNPKEWVVKELLYDEEEGIHPYSIRGRFTVEKFVTHNVTSDRFLWRLRLLMKRVETYFWNGLYFILYSNLWNGPHGLRAMNIFQSSFYYVNNFDSTSGEILLDLGTSRSTYAGNLQWIKRRYDTACSEFESVQDEGILGKDISRPFHRIYHGSVLMLATIIVFVGQPLLTLCTIIVSIGLVLTSFLWAASIGILVYVLMTLHVVFLCLFSYILVGGVGQILFKIAQTIFFEIPLFLVKGIAANLYYGAATVYDALLLSILKNHMRVPGVDSYWAKRIHGPGLASHHYYQIEPNIATFALKVHLELEEVSVIEEVDKTRIKKPLLDFNHFFTEVAKPLRIDPSSLPLSNSLILTEVLNLESLNHHIRQRRILLREFTSHEVDKSSIRLSQDSLDHTLAVSRQIVATFYTEHLSHRMNVTMTTSFWISKNLSPEDFEGLTEYYYRHIFGDTFLEPLQITDNDFVYEVKQPKLRDIVENYPDMMAM